MQITLRTKWKKRDGKSQIKVVLFFNDIHLEKKPYTQRNQIKDNFAQGYSMMEADRNQSNWIKSQTV